MMIQTVLGPISADDLGFCLPHEHLHCDLYRVTQSIHDVLLDVELVVPELAEYRELGGSAILEVTPPDLGRDPRALVDISQRTGVTVVMGCGRYREPTYGPELWRMPTAAIAAEFIDEIENGVDGIRPGIIGEIGAQGSYVSPVEEKVHRAAARAQVATGLGITTHAIRSAVGLAQLDIFEEEGVDLRRVAIGHCDSFPDRGYLEAIARRGAFVEIDLLRGEHEATTRRQVALVVDLVTAGYSSQILLSQDVCYERHLQSMGGRGYTFIVSTFLDLLRKAGVSDEQITEMTVLNPRRLLVS